MEDKSLMKLAVEIKATTMRIFEIILPHRLKEENEDKAEATSCLEDIYQKLVEAHNYLLEIEGNVTILK